VCLLNFYAARPSFPVLCFSRPCILNQTWCRGVGSPQFSLPPPYYPSPLVASFHPVQYITARTARRKYDIMLSTPRGYRCNVSISHSILDSIMIALTHTPVDRQNVWYKYCFSVVASYLSERNALGALTVCAHTQSGSRSIGSGPSITKLKSPLHSPRSQDAVASLALKPCFTFPHPSWALLTYLRSWPLATTIPPKTTFCNLSLSAFSHSSLPSGPRINDSQGFPYYILPTIRCTVIGLPNRPFCELCIVTTGRLTDLQ
jgi:hypothetical protein